MRYADCRAAERCTIGPEIIEGGHTEAGRDFVGLVNMISGTDNFSEYICMKKSCLISIPYANIDRALDEVPAFIRAMLEDISQKSRNLVQLVVASRHKKTRERICAYLFSIMKKQRKVHSAHPLP